MDRRAWRAAVHGVSKNCTWLSMCVARNSQFLCLTGCRQGSWAGLGQRWMLLVWWWLLHVEDSCCSKDSQLVEARLPSSSPTFSQVALPLNYSFLSQNRCFRFHVCSSKKMTGEVLLFSRSFVSDSFCDPVDCSTPCFPVLHHLPEFAQVACNMK